jgi:hypothetical protein
LAPFLPEDLPSGIPWKSQLAPSAIIKQKTPEMSTTLNKLVEPLTEAPEPDGPVLPDDLRLMTVGPGELSSCPTPVAIMWKR